LRDHVRLFQQTQHQRIARYDGLAPAVIADRCALR